MNFIPADESALAAALTMQPIQVQVKANLTSFQMYRSGVYDDPDCTSKGIDHSMLLVGYGTTDNGMPYWILKNSWGKSSLCYNRAETNSVFKYATNNSFNYLNTGNSNA